MNDAAIDKDPPSRVAAVNCERTILHECYHFGGDTEEAHGLRNVALRPVDRPHVRFAEAHCRLDQCIEHRFQIERRATDDLEHIGSRGLLLQRLAQLVEQPSVLDGDDGLSGEILHQLDLPIGERADGLPVNADSADQLIVFEHRYADHRPIAGEFGGGNDRWITLDVGLHPPNVGDLDNLFGSGDPSKGSVWLRRTSGSRLRASAYAGGASCMATTRNASPSRRNNVPNVASQMGTAFARMVWNTGSKSP